MNIRQTIEQKELKTLSEFASKSVNSLGRNIEEKEDDIRTCYAKDRDRIIHSHTFRREKHKTQVFIMPKNDHVMDRLTHTLEVAQIAKTIATSLDLNETLTEAIALGHDTAHTCFGHAGERALSKLSESHGKGKYKHAEQAERRLNILSGLNLTKEVMDGIKNHSGVQQKPQAMTLEGQIVQYADKIAYLTSDMENAISMQVLKGIHQYPEEITKYLGNTKNKIINKLVCSIIEASYGKPYITMDDDTYHYFTEYRNFNFKNIYYNPILQESNRRCEMIVEILFDYYVEHPEYIRDFNENYDIVQNVIDYIAGMTDNYATDQFLKFGRR